MRGGSALRPARNGNLDFIPTGGVGMKNLAEYLSLPIVAAVGGSWMVDKALIAAGRWSEITRLTEEALAAAAACSDGTPV